MKCSVCHKYHNILESCPQDDAPLLGFGTLNLNYNIPKIEEPLLPKYELPKLNLNFPKIEEPILPKYELPKLTLNLPKIEEPLFPKYEPPKLNFELPKIEPRLLPPEPVRDISYNTVGYRDTTSSSYIRPIHGGPDLMIQGNFVRDVVGNVVGQMGPGNIIHPPYIPPGY